MSRRKWPFKDEPPRATDRRRFATSQATEPRCPVCGQPVAGASGVACSACGVRHHHDCWSYASGCAIYGCRGRVLPGAKRLRTGARQSCEIGAPCATAPGARRIRPAGGLLLLLASEVAVILRQLLKDALELTCRLIGWASRARVALPAAALGSLLLLLLAGTF